MNEEPLGRTSRQRGQPLESQLERIDLLAGRIRVHHQLDTPLPCRQESLHHVSQGGVHHHDADPGHGRPRRENQLDHALLSEGQQRLRLPHPCRLPGGEYDSPETRRGSSLVHHGFKPSPPLVTRKNSSTLSTTAALDEAKQSIGGRDSMKVFP